MTTAAKIALITGASRGLGRSMAINLARKGVDVIGTYRSGVAEAEATAQLIRAEGRRALMLPFDAGDVAGIPALKEAVMAGLSRDWSRGQFDYLVNNAGFGHHADFAEMREADLDNLYNVHFKSVYFLTQAVLPMIADGGRILNISTGLTRFSLAGYSAYASMKGAVEVLTRYLAKELGSRGITVNTLAPGAIETDFGGGSVRDNREINAFMASVTALGRAGLPEDIGTAAASLLSDDNAWITAQRIEVSGGMYV